MNTEIYQNSFLTVVPDGSTDWNSQESFPKGLKVWCISFYPSSSNDVVCLKEGSDEGPVIFKAKDVAGGGLLIYLPGNAIRPYLDVSECTFNTPSDVRISFYMM